MAFEPGIKTDSGYLALPDSGSGPGVLALHAWWGLNDFFVSFCDRLAKEGFVVLAPDLYSGAVASTIDEAEQLMSADSGTRESAVLAAVDALRNLPATQGDRIGVVGFSMGAWWALRSAVLRPKAIAATVFFYGVVGDNFAATDCVYQGHFGEKDHFDSLDDAHQMEAGIRAAGKEMEFYAYPDAGHWFFESDRADAYDAESAALAWDRTVAFLHRVLDTGSIDV